MSERIFGNEHETTLYALYGLGQTLIYLERYDEAERIFRQTLRIAETIFGKDHPEMYECMNGLAIVLKNEGKYD